MSPRTTRTLPTVEPIVPVLGSPPLEDPKWILSPNSMASVRVTNVDLALLSRGYIGEARDVLHDMHSLLRHYDGIHLPKSEWACASCRGKTGASIGRLAGSRNLCQRVSRCTYPGA
jgi:hypothetical protein